jgi:hypothetical protein
VKVLDDPLEAFLTPSALVVRKISHGGFSP